MQKTDVIIIGAGASGLMCAMIASEHGKNVIMIDHNREIGRKILISGGGKCNFTNLHTQAENYYSENSHFVKSALSQYSPFDFIKLLKKEGIEYFEKKDGQLFCKKSSRLILQMLEEKCKERDVSILTNITCSSIAKEDNLFYVNGNMNELCFCAPKLVIATGGQSFPVLGATNFGIKIAKRFKLEVTEQLPALVPFIAKDFHLLSGISLPVSIKTKTNIFSDDLLITHRGFSGPAILQASLYWNSGEEIIINFAPEIDLKNKLIQMKTAQGSKKLSKILIDFIPTRLATHFIEEELLTTDRKISEIKDKDLVSLAKKINSFNITPSKTEGFKKAEVTRGGVSTSELSSKTMECLKVSGLFFIGEVVDVTGQLGGFNFQWAWSSGYVAGINL